MSQKVSLPAHGSSALPLERHPFEPFIPEDARLLVMGTFPPASHRWSMPFYYPNLINDFWRIMGLIDRDDPKAFITPDGRGFLRDDIEDFLRRRKMALSDTGVAVRRLKGNASDKFLEIVEERDLEALLQRMPHCHVVATTGQKAAEVVAGQTDTPLPKMGEKVSASISDGRSIDIFRMPSTSRAYPLALAKKAEFYRHLLESAEVL